MKLAEHAREVSVILPCRNEEAALQFCLQQIKKILKENKLNGEIIVSDSSEDSSPGIARAEGVILVKHDQVGYGRAYLAGFKVVQGKYIFCADADGTYDFNNIPLFLAELKQGYDFVIGNRFKGKIVRGAMPWSHRYLGNPLLSWLFRLLFRSQIGDINSGMRAFKREILPQLKLQTVGMEFASEMVIKVVRNKLRVKELSINYYPRRGKSKLNSFADGWRHLRFMLLYSPLILFLLPGLLLAAVGGLSFLWFYFGQAQIGRIVFVFHPLFISAMFLLVGYQLIIFAVFAKTYALTHLQEESVELNRWFSFINLERGILLGLLLTVGGLLLFGFIFWRWFDSGFGALNEVKNSVLALVLISLGFQTFFSSFMLSILSIKEK